MGLSAAIATIAAVTTAGSIQPSFGAETGDVPRTGDELIEALTALLPEDVGITGSEGEGLDSFPHPYASLQVEDGAGGASIDLGMYRWATDDWRADSGCAVWEPAPAEDGVTCEETELPDGSVLSLVTWEYDEEGIPEEGIEPWSARSWDVYLEGPGGSGLDEPGGRSVSLSLYKDFTESGDPDSYEPPVDIDELAEIVQAPVWQEVLDAADEQYGPPEDWSEEPSSDIPADELRATFRELAPEGLEITDGEDDEPGWATLTIDDGNGPAQIDITAWDAEGALAEGEIEAWGEGGEIVDEVSVEPLQSTVELEVDIDAEVEVHEGGFEIGEGEAGAEPGEGPDCETEVLEDGTEIVSCTWEATGEDDPVALWWAEVYYPDGSSLDITQTDDTGDNTAPLSLEELTDIATADEWQALLG
ncbi:hypothetical protein [Streptomyces sp. NBC_01803]|uniref:hypothetical protein n=1 Tax=Streptomyces sp. NBC_01803 TaxID=2975946 RepID=UPI002DD81D91|nr:hypothetical protein [Streptomyces sp. NBC_01803]WSA45369.1 hypothetical protein OIE51_14815 [Streptomyces sp. NBC_01803]